MTQGLSADKILYAFKLGSEPLTNKIHILGLQGATSGTNTKTLQSTATKTITLKMLGSANQQRVVDVIFTNENVPGYTENLYKILKDVWKNEEIINLWRIDFNTVSGTTGSRTASAEYAQCLLPNFPITEGLAGILTANITFEVNGLAVDETTAGVDATISETQLDAGVFDLGTQDDLYSFSDGTDIGVTSTSGTTGTTTGN